MSGPTGNGRGARRRGRGVRAVLGLLILAACTPMREQIADRGRPLGFRPVTIAAGGFPLFGMLRTGPPGAALTVYIEGDGYAWIDRATPAADPTPRETPVFDMAAADRAAPAVLYLARPCQFAAAPACTPALWTTARYGAAAVAALSGAIDRAKADAGAGAVELVGWSGGGVMAALVAARRRDVALIVTAAANLDTAAWARHHGVTPLDGSLDPVAAAPLTKAVPQMHYHGGRDGVVPSATAIRYLDGLGESAAARQVVIAEFDHRCCWAARWPDLMAEARRLRERDGALR
ncbi:MAG: alpha/beta hydrolase family protein [Rhodospirillales bacterium]